MKRTLNLILIISVMLLFTACCVSHDYAPASCTAPETCKKCGKETGTPLGHTWIAATCAAPKTCETCGETEGEALDHTWIDATLTEPETCSVCGETRGDVLSEEEYYLNMLIGSWRGNEIIIDGKNQPGAMLYKISVDENYEGTLILGEASHSITASFFQLESDVALFLIRFDSGDTEFAGILLDESNLYYNNLIMQIGDITILFEKV